MARPPPPSTAHFFFLLLLSLLAAAQAGYRVVSVSGAGGQLSARLELAGAGHKAELGPDVQRLSLTARQVRSSWIDY
jgi:alpha-glucosidase